MSTVGTNLRMHVKGRLVDRVVHMSCRPTVGQPLHIMALDWVVTSMVEKIEGDVVYITDEVKKNREH